ncbi:MAG: Gfo/Idh/MocA family oxidoreductase, partial [Clostridia bacterium]|nr:Gfo/Idh/MocA family oxidoreductase [Clostridia bacterium]
MNTVKFGIIGVGNMGSSHLRSFLEGRMANGVVTALADIDPDRLKLGETMLAEYRKKDPTLPDIALFSDADDMIKTADIDAVLVAVPHYDHPRYAIAAMQNGKHVMCEKPAGVYTLQVKDMIAEADRHPELRFGMMFNQRTNCVYRKMKEILSSGELGAIKRTSWIITNWYRPQAYYNSGAWRATWSGEGGGVLLNQCPHNLDLWQWICGMPKKVLTKMH